MINAKIGLMIAAAIAVLVAAYFAVRSPTTPTSPTPIGAAPTSSLAPSPQYFHDHPEELEAGKAKCNQGTAPSDPFCTNVRKGQELVEVDAYSKAVGGGTGPK